MLEMEMMTDQEDKGHLHSAVLRNFKNLQCVNASVFSKAFESN